MAHAAGELGVIRLPLDQVVVGARADGGQGHCVVAIAGQHDRGKARRRFAHAAQRVQPLAVGQPQVDQHEIDAAARQAGHRLADAGHGFQVKRHGALFGQRLPDQVHVRRIVFDQKHAQHGVQPLLPFGGSLTMVSQKSSMAWTTFRNWFRSIGLVMKQFA